MKLYPMMVSLEGKRTVVVGGGQVAERKIRSLFQTGCEIMVVCLQCTENIMKWAEERKVLLHFRAFDPIDLKGATIVIAATNDPLVNLRVYQSTAPHQWINIVDRPDLCTFFVPGVVERGSIQIAISTGGKNPGLTKKLKTKIEQWVGPEYEDHVSFLGEMRKKVLKLQLDPQLQRFLLSELLDERFLKMTREGRIAERDKEAINLITWSVQEYKKLPPQ